VDIQKLIDGPLGKVDPRIAGAVWKRLKRFKIVRRIVEKEYDSMMKDMKESAKPYRGEFETYARLPDSGRTREEVLDEMRTMYDREADKWRDGFVSGAVYHGDESHIDFLNEVYAINSQSNPLHADIWPSAMKFEGEVVSMTAQMLGADVANASARTGQEIVGAVSSGGTESILLAMKAYRDHARETRGITAPEMVVPVSAHAAFDKASQYFGIKMHRIPVGDDFRADVDAMRKAINRNTIVVVGSAPSFPHGVVDPIEELSEIARRRGIGCHVDACLGGFLLPWARELGYRVPAFDFRLPGVTSMSADTHKYGYAAKGTSVVLYRGRELRHYQYYTVADWPGGLYFSPTIAGSRPGALSASCWAAMVSIGADGYRSAAKRILETAKVIREGLDEMEGIRVLGDPLWVLAFDSPGLDIYRVMAFMTERGWSLNGLHRPPCVHLCVTLRHTEPGVAERFLSDLGEAVAHVRAHPSDVEGMAPVYGMAATVPVHGMVSEMLCRYMDVLYDV
jgi:glutamate/tyrosine decarboxylase-like PLP-dependent enzyme